MTKMYTTQQAADMLGYNDASYIRKMIKRKKLRAIAQVGSRWLISEDEIKRIRLDRQFKEIDKEVQKEKLLD